MKNKSSVFRIQTVLDSNEKYVTSTLPWHQVKFFPGVSYVVPV